MCSAGIMNNGSCEQVLERVNLYGVDGSVFGATDNCEFAWPLYIIHVNINFSLVGDKCTFYSACCYQWWMQELRKGVPKR